jgi:hypothetical protein
MYAHTFVALSRRLTLVTLPLPWMLLNADDVRAEPCLLAACGAAVAGSMLGSSQACCCCTAAVPCRQLQPHLQKANNISGHIVRLIAVSCVLYKHDISHTLFRGLLPFCWCT